MAVVASRKVTGGPVKGRADKLHEYASVKSPEDFQRGIEKRFSRK